MTAIANWLAPPVFEGDEEKTRQAMLINVISLMCIAFALVVMAGAVFGGTTPTSTLIIDLFACVMFLQFLRWLRNGRVALARAGLVLFGLVYITGATASIGTIRTPTAAILVFWILMTGSLYDLRGILVGTAAASLSVLGLIVAENRGWLRQPFQGVGVTQWITFTALFGFTSGLTYYLTQGTKKALLLAEKEIERRRQMEDQIRQMAFYDPLTKLLNRRLLIDRLSQTIASSKRSTVYGALIFVDLDDFKSINDTHGHATGDLLLVEVARRLTNCVREIDTVARFGGDEFILMINELAADDVASRAQADIVAQKIQSAMSQPFPAHVSIAGSAGVTFDISCTASIGVTVFSGNEVSQDAVIGRADAAMYQAKKEGSNLVRFHEAKVDLD